MPLAPQSPNDRAHYIILTASEKIRVYLSTCGITEVSIEEIVADGADGIKYCAMHVNFPVTGREGKSESRSV